MRIRIALTALPCLVLSAAPASTQSYEGRGYGGPLYVGPNFEKGGQHATPDYGFKPSKKAVIKREVVKARKAQPKPEKQEVATEKERAPASEKPAPEKEVAPATAEAATTSSPATETAASSGPVTCKRFEPTAGQTITVPCQ